MLDKEPKIGKKEGIGKSIVGVYKGHNDIDTKIGMQIIWQFVDEDGNQFGLYGFTNLNRAMENVKLETLCRLTYNGTQKVKTKFGIKDVHQVLVEIDTDDEASPEPDVPF